MLKNFTELTCVNPVPVIMTLALTGPLDGAKDVMVGSPITVNEDELKPVPEGEVTEMVPLVEPAGTAAVIFTDEFTVKFVAPTSVPLNFTELILTKLVPLITTDVPAGPVAGVKLVRRE